MIPISKQFLDSLKEDLIKSGYSKELLDYLESLIEYKIFMFQTNELTEMFKESEKELKGTLK